MVFIGSHACDEIFNEDSQRIREFFNVKIYKIHCILIIYAGTLNSNHTIKIQ